jgi:hypothetical protein
MERSDPRFERVLEVAESLNMHMPARPGELRVIEPRFALVLGRDPDPNLNVVQRLRIAEGDERRTVDEVRALARRHERSQLTWEVGSSATHAALHARLLELGMKPHAPDALAACLVLARPLDAPVPDDVEVRRVETAEDFAAASRVLVAGFGMPPSAEGMMGTFEEHRAQPHARRYLACIDGEPVGAAEAIALDVGLVLGGGATLPGVRGRGVYRALLAARFREAARQGPPVLLTQAGAMSRPILERLGFAKVAEVRILLDEY